MAEALRWADISLGGLILCCVTAVCGFIIPSIQDGPVVFVFALLPIGYSAYTYSAKAMVRWGVAELVVRFSGTSRARKASEAAALTTVGLILLPIVFTLPIAATLAASNAGGAHKQWVDALLTLIGAIGEIWFTVWLRSSAEYRWKRAAEAFYTFD